MEEAIIEVEEQVETINEPSEPNIEQVEEVIEPKKQEIEKRAEELTEKLIEEQEKKRRFPKPNFKDIAQKKIKEKKLQKNPDEEIVLYDFSDLDEL